MKITIRIICLTAALAGFTGIQSHSAEEAGHTGSAKHPGGETRATPPAGKVVLENDSVRVVRITIGPHEKTPMHDISPRLIVWITDGRLKLTFPDGATMEDKHNAGDAEWLDAQRHAGENLGDSSIVIEAVMLKQR